jgi:hypothetical protein
LSIAEELAEGGEIAVIDTEVESAETYADRFRFKHLVWDPPFDPRDLSATVRELGRGDYGVVVIDSASHFWRGAGGTLDIADGRFGGWKTATPAQDDLVNAILGAKCHMILCIRAKMAYEVEQGDDGKQKVTKLGLAPIQRDDLEYELQVVGTVTMEHRIDIGKTRCPDLAGASFHPNHEKDLARIYGAWLKGGEPIARQIDVDQLVADMNGILDEEIRKATKLAFVQKFGRPDQLRESQLDDARAWVREQISAGQRGGDGASPTDAPLDSDEPRASDEPPPAQPSTKKPMTPAQKLAMFVTERLPDFGDDDRHALYTAVAGRPISSGAELAVHEEAKVRATVEDLVAQRLDMFFDEDGQPVLVANEGQAG